MPIHSFLKQVNTRLTVQFKDPYEKVFVKQVFYGCIRYQDFLKIFCTVFFQLHSSSTNRNDSALYSIFAYLSFFRLDTLQIQDFKKLIQSQEPTKMNVFLQFAFNADLLREKLKEKWMTVFDHVYLDETIIGGVEKNLPNVQEIIRFTEKRATGKVTNSLQMSNSNAQKSVALSESQHSLGDQSVQKSEIGQEEEFKKITQPVPFNLTKPKPKMIPVPQVIKREVKANPVPKNLNRKSLADIENDKLSRRKATVEAIRKDYEENPKKRFDLVTAALPSAQKQQQTIEKYNKMVQDTLQFEGIRPKSVPDFTKHEAQVKLNVAALKREKHLIDKEEREAAQKLAMMEMGLKDASEFIRWQREMEQKDDIEKTEHIIKKKIEMELSREQAILAQKKQTEENHELAVKIKKDMEHKLEEREQELKVMYEERKKVVQQVQSQKHNASEAIEAKKAENREIRDQINKELEEAAKRLKDEQEAEQARKEELIRQIRELEKIPIQRTKGFDPTEAGSHGLMIEMSVAELRERLELNRRKLEQEIDFKRETNLAKKEREAQSLIEDSEKIHQARIKRKQEQDQRREQQEREAKEREQKRLEIRERGLMEAYANISKKKKDKSDEAARLAQELKEIKLQRQYLNANAAMVEYKAWQELEKGKEREIRDEQNLKLLEQCGLYEIKVSDQIVLANNAKTDVVQKLEYDKGYQERLNTRKKENEHLHKKTLEYKSHMHEQTKQFKEQLRENELKRKPFNAKINEQSLANATAYKNRNMATNDYIFREENSPGAAGMDSALDFLNEAEGLQNDIDAKLRDES